MFGRRVFYGHTVLEKYIDSECFKIKYAQSMDVSGK